MHQAEIPVIALDVLAEVTRARVYSPCEGLLDCLLKSIPGTAHLLIETTVADQNAVLSHFTFLFGEELGVMRPLGQEDKGGSGNHDGNNTLNKEEPLPRMQASNAVHVLKDTSCQETRNNVRDSVASVPDSHADRTFFFGVPTRGHESQTREEGGFSKTNVEANHAKSNAVSHGRHADRSNRPHEHDGREEESGVGLGEEEVTGELTDEVADVEGRDTGVPDCVAHT